MKDLTSLFSDLNVLYSNNKHAEVAKTCKRLIDGGVEDRKAVLRHWLIALVKSDQYKQSWDLLTQYSAELSDEFYLERLYVLYKLGYAKEFEKLYQEVKSAVHEKNPQNRGLLHVRAQFCFKNGKYDEAMEIYRVLAQNNEHQLDNETELACNERAAMASSSLVKETKTYTALHEDSYDLLFNESLIALAQDLPQLSLEHLEKASAMTAQDGLADDIFAIELQKAYVLHRIGELQKSKAILNALLEKNKTGSVNYLLAFNNLKSLQDISKYTSNIPLLLREMNVRELSGIVGTLGLEQQQRVVGNLLFLNLFSNSSIQAKKSILSKTLAKYQKVVDNVVLEPYYTQAKKMYHFAMSAISCGVDGSVVGLMLLAVQLQVAEKQYERAVLLCETFLNKCSAGVGASYRIVCYVLFELYQKSGRANSASILLDKIYDSVSDENVEEDPQFWRFVAFKLLARSSSDKSNNIFSTLQRLCPDLSLISPGAEEHIRISEDLDSLINSIDVDHTKEQGISPFEGTGKHKGNRALGKVLKKRRVHKNRKLPKNYDPAKQPNPERWLPTKDRSDFKPNKKVTAKQTQGGGVSRKGDQSLDISKKSKAKKGK
ncbi:LAME_0B04434g1_1 [Lachancea meyersii CBS 8951]|uniref:Signal recognition particle subunit SRP72 n=1 Tax=Lachancea meyersii CBS 8951 TaxID=1266667 RepID=A0A1G4IUU9_9SACH|nr:LAME_0B04434g1_1 [Lachancea meyersii CBS 8951]